MNAAGGDAAIGFVGELSYRRERDSDGKRLATTRLGSLALQFVIGALVCSPFLHVEFRPGLAAAALRAGEFFGPLGWLSQISWRETQGWWFGALLSASEANLIVRLVIECLGIRPSGDPQKAGNDGLAQGEEFARGRIIGSLERLVTFTLIGRAEFGAVGLIVAAKGLARFKDLEHRDFAEYFLIGTLLSLVLAGGIGLAAQEWLH